VQDVGRDDGLDGVADRVAKVDEAGERVASVRPAADSRVVEPDTAAWMSATPDSSLANSCSSQMAAVLTHSAMPLTNSRRGSDSRNDASMKTYDGW